MLRWRRKPRDRTLIGVCGEGEEYELRDNGVVVLTVAPLKEMFGSTVIGWYCYGLGCNTAHKPADSLEDAKDWAMDYYKWEVQG